MRNPLLITDSALAKLPVVKKALRVCSDSALDCGLYSDVQGNPPTANKDSL